MHVKSLTSDAGTRNLEERASPGLVAKGDVADCGLISSKPGCE
jgi:hypothetical protein